MHIINQQQPNGKQRITGSIKCSIYDSKDSKYHDVCFSNACAATLDGAVLLWYELSPLPSADPHVTQLQKKYAGKVPVHSIVNYASPRAHQYKVLSGTLILLNNGHEVGRWVDVTNTTRISAQINSLLRAS